jgi:AcrR family transcriptional regulator
MHFNNEQTTIFCQDWFYEMRKPVGLRERKKERTRQGILAAAHELFLRKSYDETIMEEIAARADLAVGTLYNYFPSKGELLLSLIADSDDRYLKAGQELISDPPVRADQALTDIMVLATEHCVRQLGKSIWRHVSATAMTNAGSTFGRQYGVTTQKHEQLVVSMIRALQARGDIRPDVDPLDAAHCLFSMKSKLFMNFVADDDMALEDHREEVRKGVRYFLAGIRGGTRPSGRRMRQGA